MAKTRTKFVYFFGGGKAEGMRAARTEKDRKAILGGKGTGLAVMTDVGLPVPPGFTITTEACRAYSRGGKWPAGLEREVGRHLVRLEKLTGKTFGRGSNPLLVSVRSGAAVSMPGMMDTVLNLGLNGETLQAMIDMTGDERFAWDAYRRFMQMFGDVVMGVPHHDFERALQSAKDRYGRKLDTELTAAELQAVCQSYRQIYRKAIGSDFPTDAWEQLAASIKAVFASWDNPRAVKYRQLNDIRGLVGTAVNVQTMVFGNMGDDSGTGVAFTRDPSTGQNVFYGEYLMNAQGEDVVAGIRTPQEIQTLARVNAGLYDELVGIRNKLERHYHDMQDLEFTIEKGTLYILQTRTGKRTIFAAVRMAVEMAEKRLITRQQAVRRVPAGQLEQLFAPVLDRDEEAAAEAGGRVLAKALPASPGGACGQVVFTADTAEDWARQGKKVILCRVETSPEDVGGMAVAQAVLTARGGMTSHAAVVARGMGTPCVAGAGELHIDYNAKTITAGEKRVAEGDFISLSGFTGTVYLGQIKVQPSEIIQVQDGKLDPAESPLYQQYSKLMSWADRIRQLGVRTNADTPRDSDRAVKMGAEGIGLTRTEHMFFEGDRIVSFRRFILVAEEVKRLREELTAAGDDQQKAAAVRERLAGPEAQYNQALAELLPLQRSDFEGIFRVMGSRPVTIRTLDPPLHEFLPQEEDNQREMAESMGIDVAVIKRAVDSLHETNPMLGHRGCRLGIAYPDVSAMQVRAIIEAALAVSADGVQPHPEIMIPLVGAVRELALQREVAERVIEQVKAERGLKKLPFPVKIGTMIEVPRGAITADEVAGVAEFFSFGTNDLTQMACGFSRDDAGKFLGDYVRLGIYDYDPFQVLDRRGVGELVRIAVAKGRATRPDLKIGICGEHGGEPMSVEFCHMVGLNYVSCSPFRVPVARLAAAQAALDYPRPPGKRPAAKKTARKKPTRKKAGKKKVIRKKATKKKAARKKATRRRTSRRR